MQTSRNWNNIAAVGAAIQLSPTGIRNTGRSLSGMSSSTRRIGAHELVDRYAVNRLHLRRIPLQLAPRTRPHDYRRDCVPGPGNEIVEAPHYGAGVEQQTHLFGHLAQRRLLRRFAFVDAAAGNAHCPA